MVFTSFFFFFLINGCKTVRTTMCLFTWKSKGSLAVVGGWHSKGGVLSSFHQHICTHYLCWGSAAYRAVYGDTKEKAVLGCVLLQERARGRRAMPSSLETSWIYRKRVQVVTCRQEEHRGQELEGIFGPAQTIKTGWQGLGRLPWMLASGHEEAREMNLRGCRHIYPPGATDVCKCCSLNWALTL